jgi:radical SAM superfamily enzyme YgiQ (UPF0313 family)
MGLNVLIVAVNSKYIHSTLAGWYLKENTSEEHNVEIFECSINDDIGKCLGKIFELNADVIAFSCYIWNIEFIKKLSCDLKKISPHVIQIAGGPEVSFSSEMQNAYFDYIIKGEGDEVFSLLLDSLYKNENTMPDLANYHTVDSLDRIKTPYSDKMLSSIGNKILYYESSRGCPFACSYCISGIFNGTRFFSLDRVFNELIKIANFGIKLIKFVDRTFNCNKERAKSIFSFIIENSKDVFKDKVFHFEVAGDLFDKETLNILKEAPSGIIQFEIGVQSTNNETLDCINRKTDITKVIQNIKELIYVGNINIHLDLIAGLPLENFNTFKNSFDDIYKLKPHMLQLGFLKMLKGTSIRKNSKSFGIKYRDYPPYEFLESRELSFGEVLQLKHIESVVEIFYNSGRFKKTIEYLETKFESSFEMYLEFSEFLKNEGFFECSRSSKDCYTFIYNFIENLKINSRLAFIKELLRYDYLKSDNTRNLPEFLKTRKEKSFYEFVLMFIKNENNIKKYLTGFMGEDSKKIFNQITIEKFVYNITKFDEEICEMYILIDYSYRNKVNGLYESIVVDKCDLFRI